MIVSLVQVTHFQYWVKFFRDCFSIWRFTVKLLNFLEYVKYFEFSFISINQYNINSPWPYTAKSIDSQLTQLFTHMFIQALTEYWL